MSDHENTIRNPELDAVLNTATSTSTSPRAPGAVLHALVAHVLASSSSPSPSAGISSSPPSPPPPPPLSSSQSNQAAPSISEILPRLFLSDIFTALNAPTLRSYRITHIISVVEYAVAFPTLSQPGADSHPSPERSSLPLITLHVPLADLPAVDIFSYFTTTRDFIVTALKDENARVLVHCYKGQSRSATIVAAYLISTLKMSTSDALKTMQAKRPMVLPNRGFLGQLEQWEMVVRDEGVIVYSDK